MKNDEVKKFVELYKQQYQVLLSEEEAFKILERLKSLIRVVLYEQ